MAEQKPNPSSGSSKRRRRRSSRKRGRSRQRKGAETHAHSAGKPPAKGDAPRKKRRRRRPRSRKSTAAREKTAAIAAGNQLDATLPESIFVYTHVIRSSGLDTYEFRPDPFITGSRRLEDFRVDLSPLYPDGAAEDAPIHDSALHGVISFTSDEDEPADEESAAREEDD